MKLRNKKTGEIVNAMEVDLYTDAVYLKISKDDRYDSREYDSLAELNEEWEDYEEPKGYWYMSNRGDIRFIDDEDTDWDNDRKEIGNYFETREEAEKAVEKLKAWKRLKDKWFEFADFGYRPKEESDGTAVDGNVSFDMVSYDGFVDDLKLLFGGEDE